MKEIETKEQVGPGYKSWIAVAAVATAVLALVEFDPLNVADRGEQVVEIPVTANLTAK